MASRYEVELTLSSARDLKNVNWRHGSLKPYAVVWIDPKSKCSTKVDDEGDTSPQWYEKLVIPLFSSVEDSTLFIDVVHAGSADDTKPLIGSARLHLTDVVEDVGFDERVNRTLKLKRPSGRPHGKVEVEVCVRMPRYRAQDAYYAPPYGVAPPPSSRSRDYAPSYGVAPPPSSGSRDYAAPTPPYGGNPYAQPPTPPTVGYPPYGGYSAPPQPSPPLPYGGYSAPPQPSPSQYGFGSNQQSGYGQPEEKKKSKYGMGTGLAVGAVAGVLGGLALVEGVDYIEDKIADDAAEKVEDADDQGYDDDDDY